MSTFTYEKDEDLTFEDFIIDFVGGSNNTKIIDWSSQLLENKMYKLCMFPQIAKDHLRHYVEFKNGVYDINDNELLTKSEFNLRGIDTTCYFDQDFPPPLECPCFMKIINYSFPQSKDRFFKLYGNLWHRHETRDPCMFVTGKTESGKSTLFEPCPLILGEDNVALINGDQNHPLKYLRGKNVVLAVFDEFEDKMLKIEDFLRLTAGQKFTARDLYEKSVIVKPNIFCVFIGNIPNIYPVKVENLKKKAKNEQHVNNSIQFDEESSQEEEEEETEEYVEPDPKTY